MTRGPHRVGPAAVTIPAETVVRLEPFGVPRLGGVSQVIVTTDLGDKRPGEPAPWDAIKLSWKGNFASSAESVGEVWLR
jgi:hypothetical protein